MSKGRRVYVSVGRVLSPVMILGLKFYTAVTRRPRVRVIATNEFGEILLVRGIISHRGWWTLPGGGVNRREEWAEAASRELHEETGIKKSAEEFIYVRTVEKGELGLSFTAPLFHVVVSKHDLPRKLFNPSEIADAGWFGVDDLPEPITLLAQAAADECKRLDSGSARG